MPRPGADPARRAPPDLAILAGGGSTRMGVDKAQLLIDGVRLLERLARAGLAAGLAVRVVGRAQPAWWTLPEVAFAGDERPGDGPLGGLATALRAATRPVLLTACDMPGIDAAALRWLIGCWQSSAATHGCVAVRGADIEPLFAVYAPACLPPVDAALAAGRRALHALIAAGDFGRCCVPDSIAPALANLNTPDDLALWRPPR